MPGSFCRTPCMHCFPYTFRNSVFSFDSFSHAATVHLARCSRPRLLVRSFTRALGATLASVAPWPACAGVSCGGRLPVTADREENGDATPFGTAQILWWLRVAFSVPAHACGTVTVAQHAWSALSAADGPAPPRSVELALNTQTPASSTPKRTRWTSVMMLDPLTTPTEHCTTVIARR